MTVEDDVLAVLSGQPAGMSDAELARRLGKRHQHVNQVCRRLADRGVLIRDGHTGMIANRLVAGTDVGTSTGPVRAVADPVPGRVLVGDTESTLPTLQEGSARGGGGSGGSDDPGWEGEVQAAVVRHLSASGWSILRVADTRSRERGVDVIAARDGRRLLVEVKGWPTTTYARGDRAGQPKPTQPSVQAAVWFAQGLLKLIRCHGAEPDAVLGLALPDRPRYRTLLEDSRWAFDRLEIAVFLVDLNGTVTTWN